MKRLGHVILLAMWIPVVLPASDFDRLVNEFSRQTGVEQTHIPFMGFARFVVATTHPAGTSEFKLAVFDHIDGRQADFARTADGVASGGGWNRIVRVRSRDGKFTNIYMQPQGKRLQMLVTTVNNDDAVFVEMRIKPEQLSKFIDDHDGRR